MIDEREHRQALDRIETLEYELGCERERVLELQHDAAALGDVISGVCETLGHSGRDGDDLLDAIGQLERLLDGHDHDVAGLLGMAVVLQRLCVLAPESLRAAKDYG